MTTFEQLESLAKECDVNEARFPKGSVRRRLYSIFATRIRYIAACHGAEIRDLERKASAEISEREIRAFVEGKVGTYGVQRRCDCNECKEALRDAEAEAVKRYGGGALVNEERAALITELDNGKKWANKLLDDIRSLEAKNRDAFIAGAVAGGTMARQIADDTEWRAWLEAEVLRCYGGEA